MTSCGENDPTALLVSEPTVKNKPAFLFMWFHTIGNDLAFLTVLDFRFCVAHQALRVIQQSPYVQYINLKLTISLLEPDELYLCNV